MRDAEIDAEIIDALSEIISLTGVSGRIEPDRAGGPATAVEPLAVPADTGGTASAFEAGTSRSVLGAFLARGEETEDVVGVGSAGNADSLSDAVPDGLLWAALVAAAMFSPPRMGFLLARELGLEGRATEASGAAFSACFLLGVGAALVVVDFDFVLACGDPMDRGASSVGKSWSSMAAFFPFVFVDFEVTFLEELDASTGGAWAISFESGPGDGTATRLPT